VSVDHSGDRPVIYAALGGFSCSICAPAAMTAEEITAFAKQKQNGRGWPWIVVDKSTLGFGQPTPNPCNQYPDRQHWFLMVDM
jgi:hypothetical protein